MQKHNMSHDQYLTLQYHYTYMCPFADNTMTTICIKYCFVRAGVGAVGTATAPQA